MQELPIFKNPNPITDIEGNIWDLYWMTSMIISTNIENGQPSLYCEFWPCREIEINGIKQKIIKNDLQGNEIKSIILNNLFTIAENDNELGVMFYIILNKIKSIGVNKGIFID